MARLTPWRRHILPILVAALPVLCAGAARADVEVRVTLAAGAEGPLPIRLIALPVELPPEGANGASREAWVSAPGSGLLALDPGKAWKISAVADGYWSEESQLVVPAAAPVDIQMWPTASLEARLVPAPGEPLPPRLGVRFRPLPSAGGPAGTVTCPVGEGGLWKCAVPAGTLDLRIGAPGVISHYRWGQTLPKGGAVQLGELAVRSGGAVTGWVETAEGPAVNTTCKVELIPEVGGRPVLGEEGSRRQGLSLTAQVNERGFFQIAEVPPGSYKLVARQEGFAPAELPALRFAEKAEIALNRPLVLERPAALEVFLEPALDPSGDNWRVEFVRTLGKPVGMERTAAVAIASPEGWLRQEKLSPGAYRIQVESEDGRIWLREEVEVGPRPQPLHLRIPVLKVRGTVQLGKIPLAAELHFKNASQGASLRVRSDESGEFAGALSQEGTWDVEVDARDPSVRRKLREIDIRRREGKDEARLDLVLPDTRIRGKLVDEQGTATAGVLMVWSSGADEEPLSHRVGPEGDFEFNGLAAADLQLRGTSQLTDRESDTLLVRLEEGREAPALTLVLKPRLKISGQVVSAAGPVSGAQVLLYPAYVRELPTSPILTGLDGRFEAGLPAETTLLDAVVSAPGFALTARRLPARAGVPLTIQVQQTGGTLVLEASEPVFGSAGADLHISVFHRGASFPSFVFRQWAAWNGPAQEDERRLVIPHLEAGDYAVCTASSLPQFMEYAAGRIAPTTPLCVAGDLAESGQLTLKLPSPKPGTERTN